MTQFLDAAAGYLSLRGSGVILVWRIALRRSHVARMQIAVTNEIFIVDDHASVRAALSVVLSSEGYQVASFVEGETFLAAARSRTPGCVLLDVHLPGSSGLEVLKQLDAQSHPAPVLVLAVSKRS